jgi:hypothetical protein
VLPHVRKFHGKNNSLEGELWKERTGINPVNRGEQGGVTPPPCFVKYIKKVGPET